MFNIISNQVFYTLGLYDIWNMLDNQQKETLTEAINIGIDEGIKQVKVEPEVKVNFAELLEDKIKEIQKIKDQTPKDNIMYKEKMMMGTYGILICKDLLSKLESKGK